MGQDDQPTQAFGVPDPSRRPGPTGPQQTPGGEQTHVFGGSDQATSAFDPRRSADATGAYDPAYGAPYAADPSATRAYAAADEPDTGRLPTYREGVDHQPYREVRNSFYDADFVARQRAATYGAPGQQPPTQPPAGPPADPGTPGDAKPRRRRGRLMLALGILIGLVVMGFAAAVRDATRTPTPGPTVTATATVTATTTVTVTHTPLINVPTQIPTRLPSVSAPVTLPSSFPSFQFPRIPGLNG